MRKLTLIVTFLAIISFAVAVSFFITKFKSQPDTIVQPPILVSYAPTKIPIQTTTLAPTSVQTTICQQDQLAAIISSQGAAGSIFATLTLMNTGKTACAVLLGNTISAIVTARNITTNFEQTVPSQTFLLAPLASVYSQIHYPNGPQCQSSIAPAPVTFLYKGNQTSIPFTPDLHTGKMFIQACSSSLEKTTIDIWPLSKNPITP